MSTAVRMILRRIKPSQQVVRRDPAVQPLRLARDHLHVQVAVRQLKARVLPEVPAHVVEHQRALLVRQQAHARGREQENGRVGHLVRGHDVERELEQLPQVLRADVLGPGAEGRHARVHFLAPFLVRVDFGQAVEFVRRGGGARARGVLPAVDVDSGSGGACVEDHAVAVLAHCERSGWGFYSVIGARCCGDKRIMVQP